MKTNTRGVARNLFFFWGGGLKVCGGIKLQYSCSIAVLTAFLVHKKVTRTDFVGIYTMMYPRRYTPDEYNTTFLSCDAMRCTVL